MIKRKPIDLAMIDTMIWDFDGVFYDEGAVSKDDLYVLCQQVIADIACSLIPNLDPQEAFDLAKESYEKHTSSFTAFLPKAQEAGLDTDHIRKIIFERSSRELLAITRQHYLTMLEHNPATNAAFHGLRGHVRHMILSHSCATNWIRPVLRENLKYDAHIADHDVFGMSDYDFNNKGDSHEPINFALTHAKAHPSRTAFTEDTPKNLVTAKKAHPGLITVLTGRKHVTPEQLAYIDIIAPDISVLMQEIKKAKMAPLPSFDLSGGP